VPTGERPVVNTTAAGYLLGFDDRIVVGATHEDVGFDARVTAGGQRQVLDGALELAPGLGTATLVETRVGLRPVSSDGLPMIGAVVPGVHLALGLGAWGLTLGPLFGQLAAADALGDRLPEWAGFLSPTRTAKQPDDDRS
jgi:D-amino-acid dehydrogenase